jgi:predicted ABC-class ATPase
MQDLFNALHDHVMYSEDPRKLREISELAEVLSNYSFWRRRALETKDEYHQGRAIKAARLLEDKIRNYLRQNRM